MAGFYLFTSVSSEVGYNDDIKSLIVQGITFCEKINLEKAVIHERHEKHEQIHRTSCCEHNPMGKSPNECNFLFYFVPFVNQPLAPFFWGLAEWLGVASVFVDQ
jgi:hypothetical protein